MTQTEILSILQSGAIVRLPFGKVRIWKGPFKIQENNKSQVFSLAWMNFFASHANFLASEFPVIETEVSVLRAMLHEYVGTDPLQVSNFMQPSFEKFQDFFSFHLQRPLNCLLCNDSIIKKFMGLSSSKKVSKFFSILTF